MKIIILGPPGTGKGTQAKLIAKEFGLKHISSGELIREEIAKKTELGKRFEGYTKKGMLGPTELIFRIIKKYMPKNGFILDGFPRTFEQAKRLAGITKIDYVLYISSDRDVIIKRLLNRAKIEGREDDTPKIIKERFKVYEKETKLLLKFYGKSIININGNGTPKKIFKEVKKVLKK